MNRNLRTAAPMLYALLIVVGFLIGKTVGIVALIGGAMLLALVYTVTRGAPEGAEPRRAPRQRNRR